MAYPNAAALRLADDAEAPSKLQPRGDLARWEARHPFDREKLVDPILSFRLMERRRLKDNLEEAW